MAFYCYCSFSFLNIVPLQKDTKTMANAQEIVSSAIASAKAVNPFTFGGIAQAILNHRSYKGVGKSNVDKLIAAKVAEDANWGHVASALEVLSLKQKQAKASAKASAQPQTPTLVMPGPQPVAAPSPFTTIAAQPQVVPQVVPQPVAPQSVSQAVETAFASLGAQSQQKGPRPIPANYGQVVGSYGDLRLVASVRKDGQSTLWVADNYGKSVGSLGKLAQMKAAVALLEAAAAQLSAGK